MTEQHRAGWRRTPWVVAMLCAALACTAWIGTASAGPGPKPGFGDGEYGDAFIVVTPRWGRPGRPSPCTPTAGPRYYRS